MPLGPFDEFLAHQTSETFDHVGTSDRNFYDRYYFNMHSSSDELFVITGLGQYPNLGVTDAFITVSIGTEQHTVRASRELGVDRMDTSVGPLSVTRMLAVPLRKSMRTRSPVLSNASPPPIAASGEAFRIDGEPDVPDWRPSPMQASAWMPFLMR